jgi:hypothetical protein
MHFVDFDNEHRVADEFRIVVQTPEFPCVGAKAALAKAQMDVLVCPTSRQDGTICAFTRLCSK